MQVTKAVDLAALYAGITKQNRDALLAGDEYVDQTIDDPDDTRMGLTLTIRPHGLNGEAAAEKISAVIRKLAAIEPGQYFYPASDYHITLLDLLSARAGFHYTQAQVQACIEVAAKALSGLRPFAINFRGLAISKAAVLVCGYYEDDFWQLRQRLRQAIDESILPHDERYPAQTAHITIARFRQPLARAQALLDFIEHEQQADYGSITVRQVELVYHNWFDSKKELLHTFYL